MLRAIAPLIRHAPRCPRCRALVPPSYSRCTYCGTYMLVLTPTRVGLVPSALIVVLVTLVAAAVLLLVILEVRGR